MNENSRRHGPFTVRELRQKLEVIHKLPLEIMSSDIKLIESVLKSVGRK